VVLEVNDVVFVFDAVRVRLQSYDYVISGKINVGYISQVKEPEHVFPPDGKNFGQIILLINVFHPYIAILKCSFDVFDDLLCPPFLLFSICNYSNLHIRLPLF
jgi:hypothetical protein